MTVGIRGKISRVLITLVLAVVVLCCANISLAGPTGSKLGTVSRNNNRSNRNSTDTGGSCKYASECDDGDACTVDLCHQGDCLSISVPDCNRCEVQPVCTSIDMVFIVDTSGSMRDEAEAFCGGIVSAADAFRGTGIDVRVTILAINTFPRFGFDCIENTVVALLGADVAGDASSCAFPNGFAPNESWGPATAIVASRFAWLTGATRIIVPLADEGPCNGSFPDGCNNPGDDRASIDNAIAVATAAGVVVSPVLGTGSDECVVELGSLLAAGTGGVWFSTNDPGRDVIENITRVVETLCEPDLSCDDGEPCTGNDTCRNGLCIGRAISGCQLCESVLDCEDFDVCTDNACRSGRCVWTPNYDVKTICCDPSDGSLAALDDGDACTDDMCNFETGAVSHLPSPQGTVCDDGRACSIEDVCDGSGSCHGTDVGFLSCTTDADCHGHMCDVARQVCFCEGAPELCLTATPGTLPKSSCYAPGDEVVVLVELASNDRAIVGGQFSIGYDPGTLRFVSVEPGRVWDGQSVFSVEIASDIDETLGRVFYAVGVSLGGTGARQATVMAAVRFEAIAACNDAQLCFEDSNPFNSMLTDKSGQAVSFVRCCTSQIHINGAAPELICPESTLRNSDAGVFTASVVWNPIVSSGLCEGPLDVSCSSIHSAGADVAQLERAGGTHPAGLTQYSCESIDACGVNARCDWSVEVLEFNSLSMELQVDAMTFEGPATRCLEFELYSTCDQPPIVRRRNVKFADGLAPSVSLSVPIAQYSCVSVRDPLHTLRSSGNLQVVGGAYVASFVGNPALGGNPLRGGDLNDDGVVDLIDLAIATNPAEPNPGAGSLCGFPTFHADLTGDGIVNGADVAAIQANLGMADASACCSLGTTGSVSSVRNKVSVELLARDGVQNANALDLNGDSVVTESEILRYAGGARR